MVQVSRLGIVPEEGVKAPVRVETTVPIVLSGNQTINGVLTVSGNRVLVKDQADAKENGIYNTLDGDWKRASDMDRPEDVQASVIIISQETDSLYQINVPPGTFWNPGATDINFTAASFGVSDHTLLTNIGTNTHAQIDSHIADGALHFTQGAISIPLSQINDVTASAAEVNLLDLGGLTAGWVLSADTATTASWKALPASGDVSKVGTPVDNQIGVWTGNGTIEGTTGLVWTGTQLNLADGADIRWLPSGHEAILQDGTGTGSLTLQQNAQPSLTITGSTHVIGMPWGTVNIGGASAATVLSLDGPGSQSNRLRFKTLGTTQADVFWDAANGDLHLYGSVAGADIRLSPGTNLMTQFINGSGMQHIGGLRFTERAAIGFTAAATFGELWLKSGADQRLTFTDDQSDEYVLGRYVQRVHEIDTAAATTSTTLPNDDTIPQNTEGVEVMSATITPKNSNNMLRIDVVTFMSVASASQLARGAALFQDSTAGALASANVAIAGNLAISEVSFTHWMAAGTTSATTFKVRVGPSDSSTLTFNGFSGVRKMGGTFASSITVTEYLA